MQPARFRVNEYLPPPRAGHYGWLAGAFVFTLAYAALATVEISPAVRTGSFAVLRGAASLVLFAAALGMVSRKDIDMRRPGWRCMWVAITFWAVDDLLLVLLESGYTGKTVALEIPRILNLLAYLLAAAGLTALIPSRHRQLGRLRLVTEMAVSAVAAIGLAYHILRPLLWNFRASEVDLFWAAVFPLLDVGLLLVVSSIWMIADKPTVRKVLCLFWLAFLALAIKDSASGYLSLRSLPTLSSIVTGAWISGALLLAWTVDVGLPNLRHPESINETSPFFQRLQVALPLVLTILLVLSTLIRWRVTGELNLVVIWVVIISLIGIILNQGVYAGERELQEYRSLIENTDQPAFICSPEGRLQLANPALARAMISPNRDELTGKFLVDLLATDQPSERMLTEAFLSGWSGETSFRRRDGSVFPAYLSLKRISSGSQTNRENFLNIFRPPISIAGIAHDLTSQKEQHEALQKAYEEVAEAHWRLRQLNEQLELKVEEKTSSLTEAYEQLEIQNLALQRLDQLKSDFVSMVSHELRAPLTNISAGIELVLTHPLPEKAVDSLELVQAEIRRLSHFVASILDLSALEAGRIPVYPAPVLLVSFFRALKDQMQNLPRHDRIVWAVPETLPVILADDRVLESVFFHLLDNAAKYAPEGEVNIEGWAYSGCVYLSVSDHGPGIPEKMLPVVFEKFSRLNSSDSQTIYGYGLGLYAVRRLLQAMNGDIRVENRPEGGARFIFWLPILEENHEL